MDNRILGSLLMIITIIGTIVYALHVEGSSGWYGLFLSWPSFLVVFGGGTGIILLRKHTYTIIFDSYNTVVVNVERSATVCNMMGILYTFARSLAAIL